MIESRSQTGHRRKIILSQSSAQSVASLSGAAETETKRIVPHRGSVSGSDPPRSSPEAEPRLLKKNPTERNITSYLQGVGHDPGDWPVISLIAETEGDFRQGRSLDHDGIDIPGPQMRGTG